MGRPYIIWCPDYVATSGGIKVLQRLWYELKMKGQEVYTNARIQNPAWATEWFPEDHLRVIAQEKDAISVYPEITFGNPFNSRTVVRYVLNRPGFLSGPKEYPPSDLVFPFSMVFNQFGLDSSYVLFLPVIETDIFFDKKYPARPNKMVYVGKGFRLGMSSKHPITDGLMELTPAIANNSALVAEWLNKCSVLYCYDNITAITEISRLCGCPVVIFPNGEFTREKYSEHEMGWDGLAWGLEEQERAISSMNSDDFMVRYLKLKETFLENLDLFIERTQNA